MKISLLLFFTVLQTACARTAESPLASPSGEFSVRTEVSGDEAGPTRRLCVKLIVIKTATHREMTFQTGASDVQKWALNWSPGNSLVLYSSDIGTNAYDIKGGQIIERLPTNDEEEIGSEAYKRKYGKRPRS